MKITALVENVSEYELKAKHGLSLYVETEKHKILFDLGPGRTLFDNAAARDIDLTEVDTVVISHGHFDHGGALERFLRINNRARVYVQRSAFEPHYSKALCFRVDIGLNMRLMLEPQLVLLDGDFRIDDELYLFTVGDTTKCWSEANDKLLDANGSDRFAHEQNLIVSGSESVLLCGCGHCGIVNIMERAREFEPKICVGGFHLYDPVSKKTVPDEMLDAIADELKQYSETLFYTCHCTGVKAYKYLASRMKNIRYFTCGSDICV